MAETLAFCTPLLPVIWSRPISSLVVRCTTLHGKEQFYRSHLWKKKWRKKKKKKGKRKEGPPPPPQQQHSNSNNKSPRSPLQKPLTPSAVRLCKTWHPQNGTSTNNCIKTTWAAQAPRQISTHSSRPRRLLHWIPIIQTIDCKLSFLCFSVKSPAVGYCRRKQYRSPLVKTQSWYMFSL